VQGAGILSVSLAVRSAGQAHLLRAGESVSHRVTVCVGGADDPSSSRARGVQGCVALRHMYVHAQDDGPLTDSCLAVTQAGLRQ
jgi:hypothetical protein